MAYSYGMQGAPAIGQGAPGLPRRDGGRGEAVFTIPGSYKFVVPPGVTSISAVCIGAGGASSTNTSYYGGSGGGLGWINNYAVRPGQVIDIFVGAPVSSQSESSWCIAANIVAGLGGKAIGSNLAGGGYIGHGGGNGGKCGSVGSKSGGGAGGYSGNGGDGVQSANTTASGSPGQGGGGGGGGSSTTLGGANGAGGGVGLYGEGASGAGGNPASASTVNGGGGSGGESGSGVVFQMVAGNFGGGASGQDAGTPMKAGSGAVRIIWGSGRAFPSTDVGPN